MVFGVLWWVLCLFLAAESADRYCTIVGTLLVESNENQYKHIIDIYRWVCYHFTHQYFNETHFSKWASNHIHASGGQDVQSNTLRNSVPVSCTR